MQNDNQFGYKDLLQIIELVKSSRQFREFHLKVGDTEIDLRRAEAGGAMRSVPEAPPAAPEEVDAAPAAPAQAPSAPAAGDGERWEGAQVVRSPMVGTFYRAPEPGAAPFVTPGQAVKADAIVCIIEVMKLMNSIPAGVAGVVEEVLVEDAQPVEYGQPLVVIRPR